MSTWQTLTGKVGGVGPRNGLLRMALVCGIMVTGMLTLRTVEMVLGWRTEKPYTPLRNAGGLASVSKVLGTHYIADGNDRIMPADQVETLKTKEYLLRDYKDTDSINETRRLETEIHNDQGDAKSMEDLVKRYRLASAGRRLSLNVNYYGTGASDPHVPDICWTATGMTRNQQAGEHEFVIPGVKFADGTVGDLPVRMLGFNLTDADLKAHPDWAAHEEDHLLFVAYTFNVNGEYVANRYAVVQRFFKLEYPFAYHSKVEVLVKERCSADIARPIVEAFYHEIIKEVGAVLPDAKELLAADARAKAAAAGVTAGPAAAATSPETHEAATKP